MSLSKRAVRTTKFVRLLMDATDCAEQTWPWEILTSIDDTAAGRDEYQQKSKMRDQLRVSVCLLT